MSKKQKALLIMLCLTMISCSVSPETDLWWSQSITELKIFELLIILGLHAFLSS